MTSLTILNTVLAQTVQAVSDTIAAANNVVAASGQQIEQTTNELSVWSLCLKGGFIMIPLAVLALLSIYVLVERYLAIKAAAKEDDTFMKRIRDYIHEGEIDSARNLCRRTATPYARLIEKGISRIGRPTTDVQAAIENVGNLEIARLEKGFPWLATAASGAPMLGFLGTVIGMVQAFFNMANAGSNVDITLLSGGIYTAMITTVGGLIVGIIAYFGYNFLSAKVSDVIFKMESTTIDFMDLLNEPASEDETF